MCIILSRGGGDYTRRQEQRTGHGLYTSQFRCNLYHDENMFIKLNLQGRGAIKLGLLPANLHAETLAAHNHRDISPDIRLHLAGAIQASTKPALYGGFTTSANAIKQRWTPVTYECTADFAEERHQI